MLAQVASGALVGVEAQPVSVEVNTGLSGEVKLVLVGLPDASVKESADRVASALTNSGFAMPKTRTTINLAPGDLRKEGPVYELPIALGLLAASGQIAAEGLDGYIIGGELGLSGGLRPVRGGLALALLARKLGKRGVILPRASAEEAALVEGVPAYPVESLDAAVRFLAGEAQVAPIGARESPFHQPPDAAAALDFADVKGQHGVRRAVEVAVAGGHNLLMIGPPGSGKSMISKRVPSIMPEPSLDDFLEILSIQSAAGATLNGDQRAFQRPFRAPHHTISDAGLLGGGSIPGPGEISLAHNGVLFLDELPEFRRSALEVLRQPLEDGEVTISRSAGKITLPCAFMLVAAMNPCPCGFMGDPKRECRCSTPQVQRYRARLSGPLLDRIDLHVEAPAVSFEELRQSEPGESSAAIRGRVQTARERQVARLGGSNGSATGGCNARMSHKEIARHCALDRSQEDILQQAMEQLDLSARAFDRIRKVARTIADLAGHDAIETPDLLEAIQYRSLDRTTFY